MPRDFHQGFLAARVSVPFPETRGGFHVMTCRHFGCTLLVAVSIAVPSVARAADYHHVHIMSPNATEATRGYVKHRLLYDKLWLLVSKQDSPQAATEGRAVDHLGWAFPDIEAEMMDLERKGAETQGEIQEGRTVAKYGFVMSSEKVRVEVVQP